MTHRSNPALRIPSLDSVQTEGALRVRIERNTVTEVRLELYDPPQRFENLLKGRAHLEPPEVTGRICGICPVAYQVSACRAIEDACGVGVGPEVTALRRLLLCGEWIASHARQIYLTHGPDYLGYEGVVDFARNQPSLIKRGLDLKRAGSALVELVGGKPVSPPNIRVGGFRSVPDPAELRELAAQVLLPAREQALSTVDWVAGFEFPEFVNDHEMLALVDPSRYPMDLGLPQTSLGNTLPVSRFEQLVDTACQSQRILCSGPSARYALNADRMGGMAAQVATAIRLPETCRNPFRSIVVRAVELVYAVEEALRLIDAYQPPAPTMVTVPPRRGTGFAVAEAPRGTLFHRYSLDHDGTIISARIIPPTSQNQASIEDDLRRFVQDRLDLDDEQLAHDCEQAIRNYDPCVSCAKQAFALKVVRS